MIYKQYYNSIHEDKLYPGAQKVIDSIIYPRMHTLEYLHNNDTAAFNALKYKLCDSIFRSLRLHSTMDSLFKIIVTQNHLDTDLRYLLVISKFSVQFTKGHYVPLYIAGEKENFQYNTAQLPEGIAIAGELNTPNKQNLISALDVSAPENYTYELSFSLFVDSPNRNMVIIYRMLPVFLLSTFSIILMFIIYFYTFRNWLKQKKLSEMKTDFVNSIRHEFNTPLSTIIVANRNLENEEIIINNEEIFSLTKIISRQSQRLKTLFDKVIDIAIIDEAALNKKEYLLINVIEEIIQDYQLVIMDDNVSITLNKSEVNPKVVIDKFRFTTMLVNIIENAIKYNKSIIKKVNISLSVLEKYIEIAISDNGIGMPKKVINHIFNKFYQNKNKDFKIVSGLGLGLFYTMQGIRAHGWEIKVESEDKIGSRFIIYIPNTKNKN
ncbi:sensor histidine kinase [Arachidicoccus ginsenosidimutans]|uniref:sensor histidine kinase n=1 Tax=Arachidicoccus sp. BS20 TaxID=1850526 RepID=UPI0018D3E500|nr:HAMP domain-containing sensor histidine kinase [Arachidicoccus sp. BS20]